MNIMAEGIKDCRYDTMHLRSSRNIGVRFLVPITMRKNYQYEIIVS